MTGDVEIRRARAEDVEGIVALLADDPLGRARETPPPPLAACYAAAFAAIDADPSELLAVMTEAGRVVGTLQISFLPGLSRRGAWRGQIEGVRIADSHRGRGLGERFVAWAIETCRSRGCAMVQLTTDRSRADAHRFYERLGFEASHLGYKLTL